MQVRLEISCDVVIDFSKPENIEPLLAYCVSHEVAAVIATTGLSEEQEEKNQRSLKKNSYLSLKQYITWR